MLSDGLQFGRGAGQGMEAEGAGLQQPELLFWIEKTSLEGATAMWQSWPMLLLFCWITNIIINIFFPQQFSFG